jgi:hypothetical protein
VQSTLAIGVFLRPYGTSMALAGAVYYIKRRQGPHRIHLTPDAAYMYTQFDRRSFNQ